MRRKLQLYIVSVWFLFLILLLVKIDIPLCFDDKCEFIGVLPLLKRNVTPLFCLIFLVFGAYFYLNFNNDIERGAPLLPKKVQRVEDIHSETLAFLASYIVPLACLDMDKSRSLLLLFLLLVLIGWIYVKTNLFYTNPTLSILGFKIYKVNTESLNDIIIITKQPLSVGDWMLPRKVNGNVYFAKKTTYDA